MALLFLRCSSVRLQGREGELFTFELTDPFLASVFVLRARGYSQLSEGSRGVTDPREYPLAQSLCPLSAVSASGSTDESGLSAKTLKALESQNSNGIHVQMSFTRVGTHTNPCGKLVDSYR